MHTRHVQLQIMSGERSYPDLSSSPQPPSPPRNGEEKGEKEWGFEAGGEAARLKPPGFPLPAPRSGSGEGGRGEENLATMPKRAPNLSLIHI